MKTKKNKDILKENKKRLKEVRKKYKESIPEEIRIAFGKFYIFSLAYIIFFGIIYPYLLIGRISIYSLIGIIVVLTAFYLYILIDVIKKKKKFTSTIFVFLIICVIIAIAIAIIKLCI